MIKKMFSLVSFLVGVLLFVIGIGNLVLLPQSLTSTVAGLVAIGLSMACFWLATETVVNN